VKRENSDVTFQVIDRKFLNKKTRVEEEITDHKLRLVEELIKEDIKKEREDS